MSKMGQHLISIKESEDYHFGWESAERGEPEPNWLAPFHEEQERLRAQRLGWDDYHNEQRSGASDDE